MKKDMVGVYPGSFDPITNGHLDIIKRSSNLFEELIILILDNPDKIYTFSNKERVKMVENSIANINNVRVEYYSGLLADYCKEKGACCIVKGLRAVTDFEYEFQHALINKILNKNLETIYINASSEYMYLSSSAVKQVAKFDGDISMFVHNENLDIIKDRLYKGDK
ncbi:MAG: pantetheine-phosphate adenylyltransferase [Oscillospiraceae bacterium]